MDVRLRGAQLPLTLNMDTSMYRYDEEQLDISEWLTSDCAIMGDPILNRLNEAAGYDIVTAICTKSPERVQWEKEYLEKRKNVRPLYE